MADAEKLSGEHYTVGDFADTVEAIHVIQDNLGITGTTANEAASTMSGSFGMMKAALQDFAGQLALGGPVQDNIVNLADAAAAFLSNVVPAIGNVIAGIPQALLALIPKLLEYGKEGALKLVEGVKTGLPNLLAAGIEGLKSFLQGFSTGEGGGGWLTSALQIMTSLGQAIIAAIPQLLQFAGQVLLTVGQWLITEGPMVIANAFAVIGEFIATTLATVGEWLLGLLQPAIDVVTTVFGSIVDDISAAWTWITETVTGAATAIYDYLSEKFTAVKDTVVGVFTSIYETASSVWNTVRDTVVSVVTSVYEAIAGKFNAAKDAVVSAFTIVKDTVMSVWNTVKDTVVNAVMSVYNTISEKFNAAKETISGILNTIKDTFSSIFETVKTTVHNAIEYIKGLFDFDWSLPKIKLPHFSIQGEFSLDPPSVPSIGVDWYKTGGIFSAPSVIGVGEAGPEAVLPLADFYKYMDRRTVEGGGETNVTINVYASEGMDVNALADKIQEKINNSINRRKAVMA